MNIPALIAFMVLCLYTLYLFSRARANRLLKLPTDTPEQFQAFFNALHSYGLPEQIIVLALNLGPLIAFLIGLYSWPPWAIRASGILILGWWLSVLAVLFEAHWNLDRKVGGQTWSRADFYRYFLGFRILYSCPILIPVLAVELYRQIELANLGSRTRELLVLREIFPLNVLLLACVCLLAVTIVYSLAQRALLRISRVKSGPLLETVQHVCNLAGISKPKVFLMPEVGGKLPLAYCTGKNNFVLSQYLIDHLDPDELRATIAHECGHLVHKHVLMRQRVIVALFFVACAAIILMPSGAGSPHENFVSRFLAPCLFMYAGMLRMRRRFMSQELVADKFGADLINDPELMARALVRIHELSNIPAELPQSFKNRIYHPSLAARLAALQKSAE